MTDEISASGRALRGALAGGVSMAILSQAGVSRYDGTKMRAERAAVMGVGGALVGAVAAALWPSSSKPSPLGDAEKVDDTKMRLAEIAANALNSTMGFSVGASPWWFLGASPRIGRDGEPYVEGRVNDRLTLDAMTGWPYGLPHESEGVKVKPKQVSPTWKDPNLTTTQFFYSG